MDRLVSAYLLLVVAILFGVVGQILLKKGMLRRPGFRLKEIGALVGEPAIVGGFLSYGISTMLYFKTLSDLDLSLAYPTVSLGYVLIALLSKKVFHERVSADRWAAVFLICAGVALVGLAKS